MHAPSLCNITAMHVHHNATIDASNEDATSLGLVDPDDPLDFPLEHCHIVHNGNTAVITVNRGEARGRRVDRLTSATYEEARDGAIRITGQSQTLRSMGVGEEDSTVTFTIVKSTAIAEPGVTV